MRLSAFIALRSTLSRRKAEQAILDGRVRVNGVVWRDFCADLDAEIALDGRILGKAPKPRLWAYYKPVNQIVTHDDPQGRITVFDVLRPLLPNGPIVSVGRLDYASEGLLLVSNSPTLAHELETSGMKRRYSVHVRGSLNDDALRAVSRGCTYQGVQYRPCHITVVRHDHRHERAVLSIVLTEGKNREIRNLMEYAGLYVTRLIRHDFGPFSMPKGACPGSVHELDIP